MKNSKILFKKPSLKRDDFISVLDAMIDDRIYPDIIYNVFNDELKKITGMKNILLLPSKWLAIKLIIDYIYDQQDKINRLIISNNSDPFYYRTFKNCNLEIIPIDFEDNFLPDFDSIVKLNPMLNDILFISYNTGVPADFTEINSIDVLQIADLSGSFFTFFNSQHIGKNFDFTIFSLKDEDIITCGDGAILYIKDNKIYKSINNIIQKFNLKLSDFNCALGFSQIKKINKIVNSRKKIIQYYLENIDSDINIPFYRDIELNDLKKNIPNFNSFYVLIENELNYIKELFESNNIIVKPIIQKPISFFINSLNKNYQNSDRIVKTGLSIPVYPTLKEEQLKLIANILNKVRINN